MKACGISLSVPRLLGALGWAITWVLAPVMAQKNNLTQLEAANRSAAVADLNYDIVLHFRENSRSLDGRVHIDLRLQSARQGLWLDFDGQVKTVAVDGAPFVDYRHDGDMARLYLDKAWEARTYRLSITYSVAYGSEGTGLHYYRDPEDSREYLYTDFQPNNAHHVVPCFDQPDLRARFKLNLQLPLSWEAAANGQLLSVTRGEDSKSLDFTATEPIAPYLFNVVVGDYAVWYRRHGSLSLRLLARQSLAAYVNASRVFTITAQGLDFFAEYFDEPYPFTHYDQTFVPEYHAGAMENPGSVIINETFLLGFGASDADHLYRDLVVLHEIAHMWFGNLVTMAWWDDLWLNESFASYMELVALRRLSNKTPWHMAVVAKDTAYFADQHPMAPPVMGEVRDTRAAAGSFNTIVYDKGLGVLRQLEAVVGQTAFRDAMRQYLDQHAWGNTRFQQFQDAVEQAAGRDMDDWFQKWLQTPGVNRLRITWDDVDGTIQNAVMHQEKDAYGNLREHKVEVALFAITAGNFVETGRLTVTINGERQPLLGLNGQAVPGFIQPNHRSLSYALVKFDPHSLAWLRENIGGIQREPVRLQVMLQLWHSMRAGDLAVSDYADMAIAVLANTRHEILAEELMERLYTAVVRYLDGESAVAVRSRLFQLAKSKMTSETPVVPDPYRWLPLLLATAYSDAELDYLVSLASEISLPMMRIDELERWEIAAELIEAGHPRGSDMFDVLYRVGEPSYREVLIPWIEALHPNAEAKAEAWKIAANPDYRLSLDQKRWIMQGFHSERNPQLTVDYTKSFFKVLGNHHETASWPYLEVFVELMFPRFDAKKARRKARAFLKRDDISKALRRLIARQVYEMDIAEALRR